MSSHSSRKQLLSKGSVNRGASSRADFSDPRIQLVRAFIEGNYHRRLSLTEMAGVVNLSVWRLTHVFKNEVGLSPEHYLTLVRLTRARKYLETSFRRVKEIAALVGISDVSNFTKIFKSNYGLTPTDCRKAALLDKSHEVSELPIAGFVTETARSTKR